MPKTVKIKNRLDERMISLEKSLPEVILKVYKKKYDITQDIKVELLIEEINAFSKEKITCEKKFRDFLTEKYDTNYEEWFILTETEKDFILFLLSKCNIDLSESQKYKLIDLLAQQLIKPLQNKYLEKLLEQREKFDLKTWKEFSDNKDFLEFITDIHKLKYGEKEVITYAYSRCNEVINFLEIMSYAKENIPKLKPYYYKIINQVIKYASMDGDCYPLNLNYGTKTYMADYIMTERKINKKIKKLILYTDKTNELSIAILASKNFTEEEKRIIIKRHMSYKEKKKEERKYYEETLEELLNKLFYDRIFEMRKFLKDEYEAINGDKLLKLSVKELDSILNEVIVETKLQHKYSPYYFNDWTKGFYLSKNNVYSNSLKEIYINNFIRMILFLKDINQKYQITLTTGIIHVTDCYNFTARNEKTSYQEDIFKKKENLIKKKKFILKNFDTID